MGESTHSGAHLSGANKCSILTTTERMFTREKAMELHERQQRILEVIEEALKSQGYPPTVREIGAAVGLCSPPRCRDI